MKFPVLVVVAWALALSASGSLLAQPARAGDAHGEPQNVAVFPVVGGLPSARLQAIDSALRASLGRLAGFRAQDGADTLKHLATARSMGLSCDASPHLECLETVGALSGARWVIAARGEETPTGEVLNIMLLDTASGTARRIEERLPSRPAPIEPAVEGWLASLLGVEPSGSSVGGPKDVVEPPVEPPPDPALWLGIGAGLAGLGAAVGATGGLLWATVPPSMGASYSGGEPPSAKDVDRRLGGVDAWSWSSAGMVGAGALLVVAGGAVAAAAALPAE